MTTVFGDFVFRITAPVANAIRNLKKWDNQVKNVHKVTKKVSEEEKKLIKERGKAWTNFGIAAKTSMIAFAFAIQRYSPHINAHLKIMKMNMKLLAIDVGKTWAPAFKVASNVFRTFVKGWRSLGDKEAGILANAAKQAGEIGLGIAAAYQSYKLLKGLGNVLSGAEKSAVGINSSLSPFLGGVVIGIAGFQLAKGIGVGTLGASLVAAVGMGAYISGAGWLTIPITLATIGIAKGTEAAQEKILEHYEKKKVKTGAVSYGPEQAVENILTGGSADKKRKEFIDMENELARIKAAGFQPTPGGTMNAKNIVSVDMTSSNREYSNMFGDEYDSFFQISFQEKINQTVENAWNSIKSLGSRWFD